MTGTQIKTLAETFVDDTIDANNALAWINECQISDLGEDAKATDSVTIAVTNTSTWYNLPADFIAVSDIEDSSGNEYQGTYRIRSGQILFPVEKTFVLHYYKMPTELTALTETPEAHILLHRPMALFVASRHRALEADADAEELADSVRLMNEYQIKKRKAITQINSSEWGGLPRIEVV